jgi:hypothetical protein
MLLGNRTVLQKAPATFRNGTSTAGAYAGQVINNLTQSGRNRNIYVNDMVQTVNRADAIPIGYTHPYNYVMPLKNGGMASLKNISANISNSADISGGKNADASLSALMSLSNADMGLIVSAIADLSASIAVTNAELAAVLLMTANSLSATGTLTPPILGAIAGIIGSLSGTISTSASMENSAGFMSADITPYTELSPENLASALLNSLLSQYNDPGTVGEALNNVGASGNPWASDLSANNSSGTFGERIQKLLTLAQYVGVNK